MCIQPKGGLYRLLSYKLICKITYSVINCKGSIYANTIAGKYLIKFIIFNLILIQCSLEICRCKI